MPADWRAYERQITELLQAKTVDGHARVEFDRKVPGLFSEIDRQVDVLVTGTFPTPSGETEMQMIVDCKCWGKRLDVADVEAFIGLVEDCSAAMGLLVTTEGYSEAAKARVQRVRGIVLDVVAFGKELEEWQVPIDRWAVWCERCGFGGYWSFEGRPDHFGWCPRCGTELSAASPI